MKTRQRSRHEIEESRLQAKEKLQRKRELLRQKSTCLRCSTPLNLSTACMVVEHLFCPKCVGHVRQRPKAVQLEIIARMQQPKPFDSDRDSREFVTELIEKFAAEHSIEGIDEIDMATVHELFPWEYHESL